MDVIWGFMHIPKTGGTALGKVLCGGHGVPRARASGVRVTIPKDAWRPPYGGVRCHEERITMRALVASLRPEEFSSIRWWTVVRNPFDRIVSAYGYEQRKRPRPIDGRAFRQWSRALPRSWVTRPMVEFLEVEGVLHPGVRVLRFERLQADFDGLCDELGMARAELPWENRSQRSLGWRGYYDDETREKVERVYERDLATWGYEF